MSAAKQRHEDSWVLMQARRLGFGRNHLRRRADRVEASMLWVTLVAALLMIGVGAAIGANLRNAGDAAAARQRSALHQVIAYTEESTEHQPPPALGAALPLVRVSYTDQHGTAREGITPVVIGTKADVAVTVWLDRTGSITAAPRSHADSVAYGSTIAFVVVIGSWLVLWTAFRLACIPLNRRRAQAWDAEWLDVAPRWHRGQK
ncbi:hypothetical protein OHA18_41985 [Kribbella sp. NBC_00709]|uniref:Rv1733c family protein n=1 Tax=Kribbella sp. NBC_00709 TaxID=2975972 RepID=UPI002E27FBEB|nr:hypothetical protein [Kribbella sp. NBC_00709]